MEYYRNVEDGTVKAVEHGSDAEKALLAQKTTPDSRTGQTFPLYESVTTPGAPAADISGVPDWAAGRFSEGALVKHGGKLYIAKGAVAADAAAPDTDTDDWDLIGPSPPSGGSDVVLDVDPSWMRNDWTINNYFGLKLIRSGSLIRLIGYINNAGVPEAQDVIALPSTAAWGGGAYISQLVREDNHGLTPWWMQVGQGGVEIVIPPDATGAQAIEINISWLYDPSGAF